MKKLVITGAYGGFIRALVDDIKNENLDIYLTVHTEKQLKFIKQRYKFNKNIHCLKVDITTNDIIKIEKLKPDILFCNAAMPSGDALLDINIEKIKEVFATNVIANFTLIQNVLKQMYDENNGKIIVTTSIAGLVPIPFMGAYGASKASLIYLVSILRYELFLKCKNIKIKMIEPGLYHTGFNQFMLSEKYKENSYFKEEFQMLEKMDSFIYRYLEQKKLNSIVKQMKKAILTDDNHFIYRKPCYQVITTKIAQFFLT